MTAGAILFRTVTSDSVVEQCKRVAHQFVGVDIRGRKDSTPDRRGSEGQKGQSHERDDEQARVQIGGQRALFLSVAVAARCA
jgi:hypothetical protein